MDTGYFSVKEETKRKKDCLRRLYRVERTERKGLKGGSKVCLRSFECWPPLLRLRLFIGWEGCILPRSKGLRKEQGLLAQLTLNWLGSLPCSPPPVTHLSSSRARQGYLLIMQLYTRLNVIGNATKLSDTRVSSLNENVREEKIWGK